MTTQARRLGRICLLAAALGATPALTSCDSAAKVTEMAKSVGLDPAQLTSKLGSFNGNLGSLSGSMNDLLAKATTDPKGAIDKFSAAVKSFSGDNSAITGALDKLGANPDVLKSWLGSAGKSATPEQLGGLSNTMKQLGADSGKFQGMLNDVAGKLMKNPTTDGINGVKGALGELGKSSGNLSSLTSSLTQKLTGLLG